jgi:hypothetical protein
MATEMALPFSPAAPRQLWQVPIFVLGISALIAVPLARSSWHSSDEPALARQLIHARQELAKSPAEAQQALERVQKVLESINRFPQFAAEAHFLAGSARLRLIDPINPDTSALIQVRQHFEQAERLGISETDAPKLTYRLAKTSLLQGLDAGAAAANLAKTVEFADDLAEGYGLLAAAHLKREPPDLAAALEATKLQLAKAAPGSDPRVLAQARLRLGELHLKLNNVKEGRLALEKITDPDEIVFAARALLADSYEATQEWEKAARSWDKVCQNPKLSVVAKGAVLYHLGRCRAQDQRSTEAAAAWAEAATVPGDVGQAAALRLAELRAESDAPASVEGFANALQSVRAPADYRNALVPIDEARQIIERTAAICRAKGDGTSAQRLVELYARLAPPGRDDDLLAQSADAAAQSLVEQAKQAPGQSAALLDQSRGQYLVAARAYERAAGKVAPGPDQAQWLWKSADRYLKAQQQQAALDVLTRMTQLEGVLGDENIAEAWFQAATIHHQKQQYAAARAAYLHCLTPPGRFTCSARHQLAMLDLIESKFNEAENGLQENRTGLRAGAPPDAALLEKTEYALAVVAFQRQSAVKEELREYTTAEQRYLGALQQFPESAEAPKARFYLGQCYWFVASQKSKALDSGSLTDEERKAYRKQYTENLERASVQFEQIETTLLVRQKAAALSAEEETLLWRSAFSYAECAYYASKFEEAIRRYNIIAERYQGQFYELAALAQILKCHSLNQETEKAKALLPKIRTVYDKLPDAAFSGNEQTFQRSFWLKWLIDTEKSFTAAGKPSTVP